MYCHLDIILLHLYHYFTNLLHAPMLTFHLLFLPLCPYGIICRMMFSLLTLFVCLSHLFIFFPSVPRLYTYRISILLLYATLAIGINVYRKKTKKKQKKKKTCTSLCVCQPNNTSQIASLDLLPENQQRICIYRTAIPNADHFIYSAQFRSRSKWSPGPTSLGF